MRTMSGTPNQQNSSAPQPPKLPPPKLPHIYVERGLGGGKVEKR